MEWKMIDFTEASRAELSSIALSHLIGAAMAAEREKQGARDYLGASLLGEECLRKLRYEYDGVPRDTDKPFPPEILRVFQRGHDCEARMAGYLRKAGFDLRTEKPDGGQFGFYAAKDPETGRARIRGHADGVIHGWRPPCVTWPGMEWVETLEFPMLWENKGLKHRSFMDLKRKGLQGSKPLYYAQINLYMAYLGVDRALFTAECQDTCEIWADVLTLDRGAAQEASDRGVTVISAPSADDLPRIGKDEAAWQCKLCPFPARCWRGIFVQGHQHQAPMAPPPSQGALASLPAWMK
jgi:hypothetical protein